MVGIQWKLCNPVLGFTPRNQINIPYLIAHLVINHQGQSDLHYSLHFTMSRTSLLESQIDGIKPGNVKLFLLKTESTPHDVYKDYFSTPGRLNGLTAAPIFVPVLEHTLLDDGLDHVHQLLKDKKINASGAEGTYGGAIFTSQRAVEAFAKLVTESIKPPFSYRPLTHEHSTNILTEPETEHSDSWPHMSDVPVYTVGPATSLALRSIPAKQLLQIFGSECGNGEALAHYMLQHYSKWHFDLQSRNGKLPPVLFQIGRAHV